MLAQEDPMIQLLDVMWEQKSAPVDLQVRCQLDSKTGGGWVEGPSNQFVAIGRQYIICPAITPWKDNTVNPVAPYSSHLLFQFSVGMRS